MSKELEPAATGKSGRRGNEIFLDPSREVRYHRCQSRQCPDDKTRCGT